MERELWPVLYRLVREVGQQFRQKNVRFQPWVLALVYLWAAVHDRHVNWACQPANWSTTRRRPVQLPSESTMSRRVYGVAMGFFWRALEQRLRESELPGLVSFVDGKPLPVGGPSKDPDAKCGRGAGLKAKGYKLHTLWGRRPMPESWDVTPLNVGETTVAQELVAQAGSGGYLLGDGNFDASPLYDAAAQHGYQLLTPLPENAGKGHHYQSPHRLRAIALMPTPFAQTLYQERRRIEQQFGNATCFAGGLGPLPAWIRRHHRVRTWVWAKLLINGVRILTRQRLAA